MSPLQREVNPRGLVGLRLHGFWVKTEGLKRYDQYLASADSMVWTSGGGISAAVGTVTAGGAWLGGELFVGRPRVAAGGRRHVRPRPRRMISSSPRLRNRRTPASASSCYCVCGMANG